MLLFSPILLSLWVASSATAFIVCWSEITCSGESFVAYPSTELDRKCLSWDVHQSTMTPCKGMDPNDEGKCADCTPAVSQTAPGRCAFFNDRASMKCYH